MISEERFNFVMNRNQELTNEVFASLQLLASCAVFVPHETQNRIEEKLKAFCDVEGSSTWYTRYPSGVMLIRRIQ